MTKTKVFLSTLGVFAAAGTVIAGVMMKKRGKIKVEGEIETKGNGLPNRSKSIHGQASIKSNAPISNPNR